MVILPNLAERKEGLYKMGAGLFQQLADIFRYIMQVGESKKIWSKNSR